jgi:hypothetical protein
LPPIRASKAAKTRGPPLESMSMGSEPSEDDIRMRAYHRFLERGGAPGNDFEDWLEAERDLKNGNASRGRK